MTKIKICGLMTKRDADVINQTHPDYAGIVFAPGRHQVNFEQAMQLRKIIEPSIPLVGVFVNAPIEQIIKLSQNHIIQIAQLHGDEDASYIETLHHLGIKVIDVQINKYSKATNNSSDYFMVDSGKGSGRPLAWKKLTAIPNQRLFVAGGINYQNITNVINTLHPFAVDISSGSERDGHKDLSLVKTLVEIAHEN